MTLIITELTSFGIAMAADTAITQVSNTTGKYSISPRSASKLQAIPYLKAGISCWGLGTISSMGTDLWIQQFISKQNHLTTLADFASELAKELNSVNISRNVGKNNLGFHLAGFEQVGGKSAASFYHVHDGPSQVVPSANPSNFNANHDCPPANYITLISQGGYYVTRNGDYVLYATLDHLVQNFFQNLRPVGIVFPNSTTLLDRAEYLIFWVRTMSEIYRLSNLHPGIGGRIDFMTISANGIVNSGSR